MGRVGIRRLARIARAPAICCALLAGGAPPALAHPLHFGHLVRAAEPATLAFVGLGLAAVGLALRRRKRRD